MISEQKMMEIAGQLLKKTKASQVRWLPDMMHEYGSVVRLPHSRVRIFGTHPLDSVATQRGMSVENEFGTTVGELEKPASTPEGGILDDLLEAAIEASQRKETVLNELDEALQGHGVMGGR